jgi:acyl-CoA synthetase (AMP-forming)/AMP-acid ligase II/1-acyl-sn-glycerol-3-phosphate acyltransferase/acyl carrier protein
MLPATLVDLLRRRAAESPAATGYVFLLDGEEKEARLALGDLDRAARAIGARLQEMGMAGSLVVILEPPGLDFITALFGCLYAGAIAVPLFPPDSERTGRRLRAVLADARPAAVLAPSALLVALGKEPAAAGILGLDPREAPTDLAERWSHPAPAAGDTALLQYTSGSTASPRGVRLTHANILHNQEMIREAFGHTPESVLVGWLPLYHDMGLIGNLLQPLYVGMRCILMSPFDVLARPARWLRAVSRYRATTSGAPNSAYDRCARKIRPDELAGCDLSSWQVAFNGSEPVRADTLERFAAAFAPWGFHREALYPCYGLAEATLIVAGGSPGRPPVVRWLAERPLEEGRAVPVESQAPGARQLVSSGRPLATLRLEIVDPETCQPLGPGRVGEIWLSGASVAAGYWSGKATAQGSFTGRLAGCGEGPFLRTGDLGFVLDGELFVAGRLKDLIIVRGRNVHPQDIELVVERCDPAVRPGGVAAFPLDGDGGEAVGIALEVVATDGGALSPIALAARVAREVAAAHGVTPAAVALLPPRGLPKTSSGKVQRHLCRASLLDGSLPVLAVWREPEGPAASPEVSTARTETGSWLVEEVALRAGIPARVVDPRRSLSSYGLDSLRLAELMAALESRSGVRVPWSALAGDPNLGDLAARVAGPPAAEEPAGEFLRARESRLVLSLARYPVWYLFRRHFDAVWLDRAYAPASGSTRTVYFLNHSSWWDYLVPLLLDSFVFHQRARYMMAHDIMSRRWYLRRLFQAAGVFSVGKDNPALRAAALRYAADFLSREGTALYIYPQGKARPEGEEIRFQDGIGWLHAQCPGVDFVPVACHLHVLSTPRPQLYLKVDTPVVLTDPPASSEGRCRRLEARCRDLHRELSTVADDPLRFDAGRGFTRLV